MPVQIQYQTCVRQKSYKIIQWNSYFSYVQLVATLTGITETLANIYFSNTRDASLWVWTAKDFYSPMVAILDTIDVYACQSSRCKSRDTSHIWDIPCIYWLLLDGIRTALTTIVLLALGLLLTNNDLFVSPYFRLNGT